MNTVSGERRRLEALRRAAILDTPPEPEFDALTLLATRLFRVPMSIVTFIDEDRQWFKSHIGLDLTQTARTIAFCATTVEMDSAFVVHDARGDARFSDNPLVCGSPHIRFYAGAPIHDREGNALGSFAILDRRPRELDPGEVRLLETLAESVTDVLRGRAEARDRGEPSFGTTDMRLSFLADRVPALLWTTDHELRISSVMGGALAALGLRPADVVGRPLGEFLAAAPAEPMYAAHLRALAGESADYENTWHERDYLARIEPLRDAAGQVVGTLGFALDFTERRRLEMQVLHADRLASIGILVAGIAHEMNNPLSYCIAGAEFARELARRLVVGSPAAGDPEGLRAWVTEEAQKMTRALDDSLEGAWRASQLVRDLLVFSRQGELVTSSVDVREAVQASLRIVGQPLQKVARLKLDLGVVPSVQANQSRLVQVFVNLLINAAQAVAAVEGREHEISVALRRQDGEVVAEVSDTGPGIPGEARARVFEPFFTTKPAGVGTGLGLSISRRIVEAMGGRIEVDDRPGGGAIFRVILRAGAGEDPGA